MKAGQEGKINLLQEQVAVGRSWHKERRMTMYMVGVFYIHI
jgi:hypothetical protein